MPLSQLSHQKQDLSNSPSRADPADSDIQGLTLLIQKNRKKAVTQDGRELRRYQKRWKVERLFAWLQNSLPYPTA
jgi:hypothetical protein